MFKTIAKDLLKGDSALAQLNIVNKQINELNYKITLKDSIISIQESKEKNFNMMMESSDRKYVLLEKSNKDLQDRLIKEKFKLRRNTWVSIGIGVISSITFALIK